MFHVGCSSFGSETLPVTVFSHDGEVHYLCSNSETSVVVTPVGYRPSVIAGC